MQAVPGKSYIVEVPDPAAREALKAQFLARSPKNAITAELPLIDGFAATLDDGTAKMLEEYARRAGGVRVVPDGNVSIPSPLPGKMRGVAPAMDVATKTLGVDRVWAQGITGKGVTIAVIDTGIAPHQDLRERIGGFVDLVNDAKAPYDDNGHGTHVAGTAAGSGSASAGKYRGVAPGASVVGIKTFDKAGNAPTSRVIQAIQWAVQNREKYGIDVLNMSFGYEMGSSWKDDPLAEALEKAYAAGIVPVVAAGNNGPEAESVLTPAYAPDGIAVAALDDRGTVSRDDDRIAIFSSRGPTRFDGLVKPDVAAPGVNITAPQAGGTYVSLSGTSMAAPFVAGCVALMLEAHPGLAPAAVKKTLYATGDKLPKVPDTIQGAAGVIDPYEAVRAISSAS